MTVERLAKLMGYADDTKIPNYVLDSIQLIQIDLYNVPAQFETSFFNEIVSKTLRTIWPKGDPRSPEVYLSKMQITPSIAPTLFVQTEDERTFL